MSISSGSSSESLTEKRTTVKQTNPDTSDDHASDDSDKVLEPVLSHAEKRRRKKEAKRAEKLIKDGDVQPKKKRKLKDGTAQPVDAEPTKTKRQNSVWVGNLSYKTKHEDLQEFFKWVGEITRIHMPTKVRGGPGTMPENRGCVFVICLWC